MNGLQSGDEDPTIQWIDLQPQIEVEHESSTRARKSVCPLDPGLGDSVVREDLWDIVVVGGIHFLAW